MCVSYKSDISCFINVTRFTKRRNLFIGKQGGIQRKRRTGKRYSDALLLLPAKVGLFRSWSYRLQELFPGHTPESHDVNDIS